MSRAQPFGLSSPTLAAVEVVPVEGGFARVEALPETVMQYDEMGMGIPVGEHLRWCVTRYGLTREELQPPPEPMTLEVAA